MFFAPLFDRECEVRIWGPPALDGPLLTRLGRYISAPLAPVEIRELPARVSFEEAKADSWRIGPALVEAAFVNHRGATLGYRITDGDATVAYIPDHEPAFGQSLERSDPEWISGARLARNADLLIHDSQYTDSEYRDHVGWGHSALSDAITVAHRTGVSRLALFHHDPLHDDAALDSLGNEARALDGGRLIRGTLARDSLDGRQRVHRQRGRGGGRSRSRSGRAAGFVVASGSRRRRAASGDHERQGAPRRRPAASPRARAHTRALEPIHASPKPGPSHRCERLRSAGTRPLLAQATTADPPSESASTPFG